MIRNLNLDMVQVASIVKPQWQYPNLLQKFERQMKT